MGREIVLVGNLDEVEAVYAPKIIPSRNLSRCVLKKFGTAKSFRGELTCTHFSITRHRRVLDVAVEKNKEVTYANGRSRNITR